MTTTQPLISDDGLEFLLLMNSITAINCKHIRLTVKDPMKRVLYVCACCDCNCCAKIDHIYDIQTMCLSYPASDPTHYLDFESDSQVA